MGNDKAKMGEGFSASKGGAGGPPEDRKKTLKRRMAVGLGITAVGLAAAFYGFFGVFFPAYREYKQLVGEELRISADQEELSWKQYRPGAEGGWLLIAEAKVEPNPNGTAWLAYHDPQNLAFDGVSEKPRLRGKLGLLVVRADGAFEDYGTLSNLIVNAGENFLVDAFQNLTEPENFRFHGIGLGTVAAAETDTGCGTELTTQYNPDNTRATGSLTEGASTNIYRTVGTNTVDAAVAITEFCLMSQAATGGGTIWSRVVFAAINLASGDSLQTTYDLTVETMLAWWWLGSLFCWIYLRVVERKRRPKDPPWRPAFGVAFLLIVLVSATPAFAAPFLAWDSVTTDSTGTTLGAGLEVTEYRVYQCGPGVGTPCTKTSGTRVGTVVAQPAPQFDLAGQPVPVTYAITAVNKIGEGGESIPFKVVPPDIPKNLRIP